jgi:hypothetical protein
MDNSKHIFQNMMIHETKTGNVIFDYFLNFVLLSFITYFLQNFRYVSKYIVNVYNYFLKKKYVEVIISAESRHTDKNGFKSNFIYYTELFKAICFHIKNKNNNNKDIYSKREPERSERMSNIEFDFLIPDQDVPFYINENMKIKCVMYYTNEKYEQNNSSNNGNYSNNNLSSQSHYIRIFSEDSSITMYDLEKFIDSCLINYKEYKKMQSIKHQYYVSISSTEDKDDDKYSIRIFNTNRTFDSIFFEEKKMYIEKLKFFLENETWFDKRGLPYHYGILLHGYWGCGKTSIIKATANYTKRHIFSIPLNRIKTCGELEDIFYKNSIDGMDIPNSNRIYVFEDIDCLCDIVQDRSKIKTKSTIDKNSSSKALIDRNNNSNNSNNNNNTQNLINTSIIESLVHLNKDVLKKNTDPDDKLNLSCLLNIIDGILETPGRIIIMTTNYPERIDKALLRPGRVDVTINLKKASVNITHQMLAHFYEINIEEIKKLTKSRLKDYMLSPAQITNICLTNIDNINGAIKSIISANSGNTII